MKVAFIIPNWSYLRVNVLGFFSINVLQGFISPALLQLLEAGLNPHVEVFISQL